MVPQLGLEPKPPVQCSVLHQPSLLVAMGSGLLQGTGCGGCPLQLPAKGSREPDHYISATGQLGIALLWAQGSHLIFWFGLVMLGFESRASCMLDKARLLNYAPIPHFQSGLPQ